MREGVAYVRHRADIVLIRGIVGLVGTFGLNFQLTTALMARLQFGKGAGEYGILGSIMAIGSLTGALLAARREHPRLRLVVGATLAFGISASLAAVMPTYQLFAVMLIPTGLAALTLMTAANATVQLSTAPHMRGRVMAIYMAIFMGGTPIGSPVIGWVGQTFGAPWSILVGGLVSVATATGAMAWLWFARGVRVAFDHSARPRLRVWTPALPAAGVRRRLLQVQGRGEQLVADERDDVEDRVGHDERHDPAPSPVVLREQHAHGGVADERPETLVQVVAAAQ